MEFRFRALQEAREPDALDAATTLTGPRGWVAVFVIMILIVGAGVWAVFGRLPQTATVPGLLTHPEGVSEIQSLYSGQVAQVDIAPLGAVTTGQPMVEITDAAGRRHTVGAPFSGNVISVSVQPGGVVGAGSTIATVERTDGPRDRLVAMLLVPESQAQGIAPGQSVQLTVASAPAAVYGLLKARVTAVSPYPVTRGELDAVLGGELESLDPGSAPASRIVIADLEPDPRTPSGYAWNGVTGPPGRLRSQTSVTGVILLREQRPIDIVLGR